MARVNVEQKALSDPRFAHLSLILLGPNQDGLFPALQELGVGVMARVWNECQERETDILPAVLIDCIGHAIGFRESGCGLSDAVTKSDLGERTRGGIRIKGAHERCGWLKEARDKGRNGGPLGAAHGVKGGRPRTPRTGVSTETPQGGIAENPPPAPAPAPALSTNTPDSSEPVAEPPASEPAAMTFPATGREKAWGMPLTLVAELRAAFPTVDVIAEASKARAWLHANPTRRKTARGMPKFLYGWIERSQNGNRAAQSQPERDRKALARDNPNPVGNGGWVPTEREQRGIDRRAELQRLVLAEHPEWKRHEVTNEASRRWKAEGWEKPE